MNQYNVGENMIRFNCTVDIEAGKWDTEEMKEDYIENFLDVINQGLFKMTVPDWTVNVVSVEEINDKGLDGR